MPIAYSRFLTACLSGDRAQLRTTLASPAWSWNQLFAAATEQALLPALHRHLSEAGLLPAIPDDIASFLAAVESVNRERNTFILEELQNVIALLNDAGIQPVLLKGAAYLAAGIYPDPATRYLCDLDLLIPEPQLTAAVHALSRNGYLCDGRDIFGSFRHHHPPLHRPGGVSVELHHRLTLSRSSRLLPAAQVIEASVPVHFHGLNARIPCPVHLAAHLILHSQVHHSYDHRIWPALRAMWDLVMLQRHYGRLDWTAIEQLFQNAGQRASLVLHLMQVRAALGFTDSLTLSLTPLTRLRWTRRKLLRSLPPMRYLDPLYMLSTLFNRRILLLRNLAASPGGWKHLFSKITEPGIYIRLFTDVVQGRGH